MGCNRGGFLVGKRASVYRIIMQYRTGHNKTRRKLGKGVFNTRAIIYDIFMSYIYFCIASVLFIFCVNFYSIFRSMLHHSSRLSLVCIYDEMT